MVLSREKTHGDCWPLSPLRGVKRHYTLNAAGFQTRTQVKRYYTLNAAGVRIRTQVKRHYTLTAAGFRIRTR